MTIVRHQRFTEILTSSGSCVETSGQCKSERKEIAELAAKIPRQSPQTDNVGRLCAVLHKAVTRRCTVQLALPA